MIPPILSPVQKQDIMAALRAHRRNLLLTMSPYGAASSDAALVPRLDATEELMALVKDHPTEE
ncbi:hypothetical protein NON00_02405 [Roseomonas sp. GC11]|uniref:hypothetical protein n=1 Tax=Roseomonas sp. GC11 TaxID=2950546 RepID=UPI00210A9A22|nr:hypothetical protein [Roseomonas sp. GC11]MCQ4158779.1 hypothetical protein [Roseomonas sp. GC11]